MFLNKNLKEKKKESCVNPKVALSLVGCHPDIVMFISDQQSQENLLLI